MVNVGRKKYDVLVLFGLCTLAFTQPLLSLLSEYPEFFTSHKITDEQLWFFVVVVSFVLPLALSVLLVLAGLLSRRLKIGLMIVMLAFLSSVIALPFLNKLTFLTGLVILLGSVSIGIISAWHYAKKEQFRSTLAYLSIFTLVVPLIFIFSSGVRDIAFPAPIVLGEKDKEIRSIPVVFVIFDEFTVNSIVDINGEIDPVLYPNLAWFSNRSHWFANATTVADGTAYAVPAILSGQYAKRTQPTYQAYPTNIFTLLHGTHTFNAHESASKLCPPEFCPPIEKKRSNEQQLALILIDSFVLYAHIIFPSDFRQNLPDITQGWVNYLSPVNAPKTISEIPSDEGWLLGLILSYLEDDRAALWHRFLSAIPNTPQPSLNLIHILLPHLALEYLPSGKNYGRQVVRGLHEEKWGNDDWAVKQAWQRHLLQLSYTDKLLGALFKTLQNETLFEKSLIIVTADHGLSFKKGEMRRPISKQNYMDIMPVPLFIKLPNQTKGSVSQLNVETVDILPTIVEVLNISLPSPLEGVSVFNKDALNNRKEKTFFTFHDGERTIKFPSNIKGKKIVINDRIQLFGEQNNPDKLFSIGSDKHWVGKFTHELEIKEDKFYKVEINNQVTERYYAADSGSNFVSGTVFAVEAVADESNKKANKERKQKEIIRLALTVNGKVRAVTKIYLSDRDQEFAFLVPESAYKVDQNQVEVFRIIGTGSGELRRFFFEKPSSYSVSYDNGVAKGLVDENGNEFDIDQTSLMGFLDTIVESDHLFKFEGWAVDKNSGQPAHEVVLFVDGQFVTSAIPRYIRPDVAAAYQRPNYLSSGYRFYTEILNAQLLCEGRIQIFAVSGSSRHGIASNLSLPAAFRQMSFCTSR
ncbi:MAG: sulfatase-like hydrolase/transferase [Pseudomonadales bacterium]|nr:sulfatase-like hydrolase/transferase [Pseudomonadales bacterium]